MVDNGLWARNFPDTYEDSQGNEQSVQMVMSFKDAFESFNYLEPLTWFIDYDGNKECVKNRKSDLHDAEFHRAKIANCR